VNDWRAMADLGTTLLGVGCFAVAVTSAVASREFVGFVAVDLERRALGFGALGIVLLLLGVFSEVM
jgi:hypothetical protein